MHHSIDLKRRHVGRLDMVDHLFGAAGHAPPAQAGAAGGTRAGNSTASAKTPYLPCVFTAFAAKALPLICVFPLPS